MYKASKGDLEELIQIDPIDVKQEGRSRANSGARNSMNLSNSNLRPSSSTENIPADPAVQRVQESGVRSLKHHRCNTYNLLGSPCSQTQWKPSSAEELNRN